MTELAYLEDLPSAYVREFHARITALPPGAIVLDRTYFYPAGGGQPSDRGTLQDEAGHRFEVVDVTKSGPAVVHRVRAPPDASRHLLVGRALVGSLDWDRRYRHMRLHTGQHLLSALVYERSGRRTRRANLAGASATIDLEGPLAPDLLARVQEDFDRAVARSLSVAIRWVPRAEWGSHPDAGRSGLVPLPAHVDPVRVVEIASTDACPCGGTHVRSTGEVGDVRFAPPTVLTGGASRLGFTVVDGAPSTPAE